MDHDRGRSYDERVSNVMYPERDGTYVRARARLDALQESYDFTNKRVVDLGCGRGYFALQLAPVARSILAIDGDPEKVEQARALAEQVGLSNIQFECAVITEDFLSRLDQHDVTLLLAVLHHIINDGSPYKWNEGLAGVATGRQFLAALSKRTKALFFEMGNVDQMDRTPDIWIPDALLRPAGFQSIEIMPPPAFEGAMGLVRRVMHYGMPASIKAGDSTISRAIRNATGYDMREHRSLFLARPQAATHPS